MKKGAGIVGILWGLFALLTFGLFYGGLQSLAEEVQRGIGANAQEAQLGKYWGIGLPLLALGGGAISFGQGFLGGLMMIASAAGMWWKLEHSYFALVLAGPLALAGLIAILGEMSGGRSGR